MSGSKVMAAVAMEFCREHWKVISGFGIFKILTWVYDNPLWMAVEFKWKDHGVAAMMIGAFVINTILLIHSRNKDTKWIMWNALDELRDAREEYEHKHAELRKSKNLWKPMVFVASYVPFKLAMLLLWCIKKSPRLGDLAAFLILPIIEDPFVTTIYMRHGYKNGLRMKDIAVYLASSVISLVYWAARNGIIVESVRKMGRIVF